MHRPGGNAAQVFCDRNQGGHGASCSARESENNKRVIGGGPSLREQDTTDRRRRDRCLSPRFLLETEIAERLSPRPTRAF